MAFKNFFKKIFGTNKEEHSGADPTRYGGKNDQTLVEHRDEVISSTPADSDMDVDIYVSGEKISNVKLRKNFIRVGRDPSQVDIIIAEPIISKVHCTFERAGNELFVTDNNSTNGIYINSLKAVKQQLKDGDIISLGKKGTVQLIVHKQEKI